MASGWNNVFHFSHSASMRKNILQVKCWFQKTWKKSWCHNRDLHQGPQVDWIQWYLIRRKQGVWRLWLLGRIQKLLSGHGEIQTDTAGSGNFRPVDLHPAICLPTHLPIHLHTHLPIQPPTHPPIHLPTHPSPHTPTHHPCIYPSILHWTLIIYYVLTLVSGVFEDTK